MRLHEVNSGIQKNKKPNRLGRGIGSGQGKTAARGHKGQGSRAGWNQPAAFQGGMSPLVRRVPKRGFHNADALIVGSVNVGDLEAAFNAGDVVDRDTLKEKNVLKGRYDILKVLGDGELTKKLKVSAHRFSASAKEKLDRVGCEINILTERTPVIEKQKAARAAKKK